MLQPKKYRKQQKQVGGKVRVTRLIKGLYGLKALENKNIKASQIEAVRRTLVRVTRKNGKIWMRTFPSKPMTKKAIKTRMGKGKGSVQYYVCPVQAGQIICEISGSFSEELAIQVLKKASKKLCLMTRAIVKS